MRPSQFSGLAKLLPIQLSPALTLIRVVLAVMWIWAAIAKGLTINDLAASIHASQLFYFVSDPLFIAWLLVALEMLVGLLLLSPVFQLGLLSTHLLAFLFVGYSVWREVRDIETPCSCFGVLLTLPPAGQLALQILVALVSGYGYVTGLRQVVPSGPANLSNSKEK